MKAFRSALLAGSSVGVALIMTLSGHDAAAQTAPAQRPPSGGSNQPGAEVAVGEIIVTANKRSESINKVGLTIQAFSGDDLRKQGISNVQSLTKVVPGLDVAGSGLGTPVYTLRGVGFYENSLAAYPDVSVYVDEVSLPLPVLTNQAGLDLERVEVLKGPQGILFGQNSTGGAINYIAAKPTDRFSAGADLSYGRFNTVEGDGYVSGPLTDTLQARVALKVINADDWQYSYTRPDATSGKKRVYVGRVLLAWQPTNRLHLLLNLNGYIDNSDPQAAQYSGLQPQILAYAGPYLATPFAPPDPRAANWSPDNHPKGHQEQGQVSLRGDYDVTDTIKLTSITSYIQYRRDMTFDTDGVVQADLDTPSARGQIGSFSQELRAAGTLPTWRWTVGGNFGRDDVHEYNIITFGDATSSQYYGFYKSRFFSTQVMTNVAAFANVEHDLTDAFTLKAGVRYTDSRRSFSGCLIGDPVEQAVFTAIARELSGQDIPELGPNDCNVIHYPSGLPGLVTESLNENNVSWRAGVDYHLAPTALLYVNVAQGYKAGSFATLPGATTNQYQPVRQESLLDYEGGFKVQEFDGKLSLNGAIFYYDYLNKQLLAKAIDPVFGPLDALVNIPRSDVKGVELSATTAPIRGLTISASGAYLDAEVTKYIGVSGIGSVGNYAGTPVPFTPRWQGSIAADYNWDIDGVNVFVGETSTYNSSTFSVVGADPTSFMKAYYVLDLRAGFTLPGGRWSFMAYGENVTNTYYWTNATRGGSDTIVRYAGMPATYGVKASFKY